MLRAASSPSGARAGSPRAPSPAFRTTGASTTSGGANTPSPASTTTCSSTTAPCSPSITTCCARNGSNSVAERWNQPYTPPMASRLITAEQFIELPDDGLNYELVRGELIEVSPSGFHSAEIGSTIGAFLFNFVRQHRLGAVT